MNSWPWGFSNGGSTIGLGDFITVPSRDGDYYRVTNNYFYNGRGCGVVAKASNGVVSGNSINKMLYPAIELSPNFAAKEGGFTSNNTVCFPCITTSCLPSQIAGQDVQEHSIVPCLSSATSCMPHPASQK